MAKLMLNMEECGCHNRINLYLTILPNLLSRCPKDLRHSLETTSKFILIGDSIGPVTTATKRAKTNVFKWSVILYQKWKLLSGLSV